MWFVCTEIVQVEIFFVQILSRLNFFCKEIVQVEQCFVRRNFLFKDIVQVEYEAEYERALVEVKDELREKEVNSTFSIELFKSF